MLKAYEPLKEASDIAEWENTLIEKDLSRTKWLASKIRLNPNLLEDIDKSKQGIGIAEYHAFILKCIRMVSFDQDKEFKTHEFLSGCLDPDFMQLKNLLINVSPHTSAHTSSCPLHRLLIPPPPLIQIKNVMDSWRRDHKDETDAEVTPAEYVKAFLDPAVINVLKKKKKRDRDEDDDEEEEEEEEVGEKEDEDSDQDSASSSSSSSKAHKPYEGKGKVKANVISFIYFLSLFVHVNHLYIFRQGKLSKTYAQHDNMFFQFLLQKAAKEAAAKRASEEKKAAEDAAAEARVAKKAEAAAKKAAEEQVAKDKVDVQKAAAAEEEKAAKVAAIEQKAAAKEAKAAKEADKQRIKKKVSRELSKLK